MYVCTGSKVDSINGRSVYVQRKVKLDKARAMIQNATSSAVYWYFYPHEGRTKAIKNECGDQKERLSRERGRGLVRGRPKYVLVVVSLDRGKGGSDRGHPLLEIGPAWHRAWIDWVD